MQDRTAEMMNKSSHAMQQTAETVGDTIVQVIDKLAGTKSDVRLTFEDLTFDAQVFKAKLNGSVVLDVTMAKEATA